ncbi:HAD-IIB family hydrolase [Mesorhizobium xinjiangense]|uniref:HAD-IIB family hydrolase n=1 Tax=Mesorhizobium xinjiangense TaxID=2678685 RepID=UPI0012EE3D42|nr:HAD-IIB family hydrolase [Mesorhizobium xinjiangense]
MIVFTDLDGTLLDHDTYGFEAARPALAQLAAHGVPLVPASSKTAAEIMELRKELALDTPAIVENGGGIDWPSGSKMVPRADDHAAIRACLDTLPPDLRVLFHGFGDMDLTEIAALTGLDLEGARRATDRQYSEPGLFRGNEDERAIFIDHLAGAGFHALQGGRFLTVSRGTSKAQHMGQLRNALQERLDRHLSPVVALGDAENDRAMLEAADIAVIVANPAHAPLGPLDGEDEKTVMRTRLPGPQGWNQAVLEILRNHVGAKAQGMQP